MYVNSLFNMGGLNVTFGKRLRYLREENDLSQIELAKTLNITSQALSQYELNKRMPDTEMVRRIAKYFNVSVDFLLGESDERTPAHKIKEEYESEEAEIEELMERFNVHLNGEVLTTEDKNSVIAFLKMLRDRDREKIK